MTDHGATGLPSDLDPVEACRRGECMICSGSWGPLHRHIPAHYPGLSSKEACQRYRTDCKIPEKDSEGNKVHLQADWHRKRLSESQSKRMKGPDGEKIKARIRETLSRRRPELYGKTGVHRSDVAFKNWPMLKLLAQGALAKTVAESLGLKGQNAARAIRHRAKFLGWKFGRACFCDQGNPFRYGSLFHMRKVSGFEVRDFNKFAGLSKRRSANRRPPESIAMPDKARKAIAWRDGILRALLAAQSLNVAGKDFGKDRVLITLLPDLPHTNDFLMAKMGKIRQTARERPAWGVGDLCEDVCRAAAREQSISPEDHSWRRTVRFLPQVEPWVKMNLTRLRGLTENDGTLVCEMIASLYGTTESIVQNALRPDAETIAPIEMRLLIVTYAASHAAPSARRH